MRELSVDICNYIKKEWISKWKGSIRSFADAHDVDEKTVRQIMGIEEKDYQINLYTLENMCRSREISLSEFFQYIKR
ncbi:hypothetical protein ABDK00_008405 [Niabella insulamsoli]|uniref:hypothetical protein n=1 Tax=Niabella insulamsoli TaxID=3144874 RepID=UPI0031FD26BA